MPYKRVIIDAGHGGTDSGAVGNGIVEKDLTLKISNYIHNRLDQLGVKNTMSRSDDSTLNSDNRVNKINNIYGTTSDIILVSNHINAGGGEGAEVIYALRNNDKFSKIISDNLSSTGRYVRKYYQKRLPSDTSKDYYYILRDTPNIEAVIVEYGFLDNVNDANLLKSNWESYAEQVVKSICDYIGVKYVPYSNDEFYTVKSGDTLWSISKKFNMTVDKLKDINNLKSNLISIGMKLKVGDSKQYVVKKGDTLWKIAKENNTTVDDLMKKNNLLNSNLQIGQILYI